MWWIIGILWITCGVFTWGWLIGYVRGRFPDCDDRDMKKFHIAAIIFVPFGLCDLLGTGLAILTEPGKHWYGWRLW